MTHATSLDDARTPRTVLIMAGGTGGHVFPAMAVADYLRQSGWRVIWMGTHQGLEAKLIPQKGYEMVWISFGGVRGQGWGRWLILPLKLVIACLQCMQAFFRHRPHVVLGMGGFAAFPGGLMAWVFGKPLVIHEQNAIAGLTNRILACLADRVLVAFPDAFSTTLHRGWTARWLGCLCRHAVYQWSGNPVRKEITGLLIPDARFRDRQGRLHMLVVGGSLGAQVLNEIIPRALKLIHPDERPRVVHQAGLQHFEQLQRIYAEVEVSADLFPFIEDMAAHYQWCDLVICRAGATTIAELASVGVASVLVPFPSAVDDHQTANARYLSERNAALLLPQQDLDAERLARLIAGFTRQKLRDMANMARRLAIPDATEKVARVCMELAG